MKNIMKFYFRLLAIVGYAFICACSKDAYGDNKCIDPELSRDEIIKIVEVEIERRFGKIQRGANYEIEIKREGCEYIYIEREIPHTPGGYSIFKIDSKGNVIDFFQGV